jgi:hypothetical protein
LADRYNDLHTAHQNLKNYIDDIHPKYRALVMRYNDDAESENAFLINPIKAFKQAFQSEHSSDQEEIIFCNDLEKVSKYKHKEPYF